MIAEAEISDMQQCIYIFSSATHPLYKQDVLDSLCVPAGYVIHYRYEKKHVDRTIWKQVEKDMRARGGPSVFQRLRGLVCFVDQTTEKNPASGEDQIVVRGLYPLREISVRKIELDGQILHVYCTMGAYVRYREHNEGTQEFYQTELLRVLGSNCPPDKYVCLSQEHLRIELAGPTSENQAEAWISLVKQLDNLEPFSASVFYRVSNFCLIEEPTLIERILERGHRTREESVVAESKRLRAREMALKEILPLRSGYSLPSGRIYTLELSFYREAGTEDRIRGARLVPEIDPIYFPFKPDAIEVGFRYDRYSVDLVTATLSKDALTRIRITLDKENEQKQEKADARPEGPASAPQPNFLIHLTYPRLRTYVGVGAFLIGNLMISASSVTLTGNTRLGLVLSSLGSIINTAALFWLYRRLR